MEIKEQSINLADSSGELLPSSILHSNISNLPCNAIPTYYITMMEEGIHIHMHIECSNNRKTKKSANSTETKPNGN